VARLLSERERLLGRVEREVAAMRELAENDIAEAYRVPLVTGQV
jgi:hypothetical protein